MIELRIGPPFYDFEAEADMIDAIIWGAGPERFVECIATALEALEAEVFGRPLSRDAFRIVRDRWLTDEELSWSIVARELVRRGHTTTAVRRFVRFAAGAGVPTALPSYAIRLETARRFRCAYRDARDVLARLVAGDEAVLRNAAAHAA